MWKGTLRRISTWGSYSGGAYPVTLDELRQNLKEVLERCVEEQPVRDATTTLPTP